jgi:hypothetical protein
MRDQPVDILRRKSCVFKHFAKNEARLTTA